MRLTPEPIRTREVGWPTLTLFLALTFGVLALFPLVMRAGPMARVVLPAWLENLVPFGTLLIVAIGGVLMGVGRLRLTDFGLGRRALAQGALTLGAIWLLIQSFGAVSALVTTGSVSLDSHWSTPGIGPTLLWAVVMLFSTALFEETAFRGFLYPQFALKLRRVLPTDRRAAWVAGLASQVIFAASHLPGHLLIRDLAGGALLSQLLLQGVAGALLLLVYLRTRNLWIAVGLHGLANAPTPLVPGAVSWEIPLLVLLVGWPWLSRRPEHRGLAHVERIDGTTPSQVSAHSGVSEAVMVR